MLLSLKSGYVECVEEKVIWIALKIGKDSFMSFILYNRSFRFQLISYRDPDTIQIGDPCLLFLGRNAHIFVGVVAIRQVLDPR